MTTLLHFSDTHFGTETPTVIEALYRQLQAKPIDAIILSGDLTQRARLHQFRDCRTFIDGFGMIPLLATPGNHDIPLWCPWERLFTPYRRYQKYFPTDFDRYGVISVCIDAVHIIGVRTTRRYRHLHGELSDRQIDRVGQLLQQAPANCLQLVVCHQPLYVLNKEDEVDLIRGAAKAVPLWRAAGAGGIVSGHIHRPFITPIPYSAHSLSMRPLWAIQAGTTTSRRLRDQYPNAFNVISNDIARVETDRIQNPLGLTQPAWMAALWLYDHKTAQFLPSEQYWIQ
ncbi:MAG: metallophosphoesterase [Desulfobulbaceae bacterium]|nr:metallophosphoesterase [Desulfobulbaceae bacterium]